MRIRSKPDFWSGIMFLVIGILFAWGATNYAMGTSARMGPGYFPFWLGVCQAALGALVAFNSLSPKAEDARIEPFDWRMTFIIIGSVAMCGVVFNFLGVYISIFLLVLVSSMASHVFSWKVSIINGLFMVVFVWLAFVKGLGLIFPLWPSFLGN